MTNGQITLIAFGLCTSQLESFAVDPSNAVPPVATLITQADDHVDITTESGIVYRNCKITRVEPDGLTVMSAKGITKIGFPDLSEEYRKKHGYNQEKASNYSRNTEQKRAEAYTRQQEQWRKQKQEAEVHQDMQALIRNVSKQRMAVVGEVLSVAGTDILLSGSVTLDEHLEIDTADNVRRITGPRMRKVTGLKNVTAEYEPIFIVGVEPGLHDGARWAGAVYPAGVYNYTSVAGASKTVKRYATSPELAVQAQLDE